jgi:hypothetical protein
MPLFFDRPFFFLIVLTRAEPATQDSYHEASKDTKKGQVKKKLRAHLTFVVQQLFFVVFVGS